MVQDVPPGFLYEGQEQSPFLCAITLLLHVTEPFLIPGDSLLASKLQRHCWVVLTGWLCPPSLLGSWPWLTLEAGPRHYLLGALGIFCLVHLPSGNYSHSFYASSWEELLFSDSLPIGVLGMIEIRQTRRYLGSRQRQKPFILQYIGASGDEIASV